MVAALVALTPGCGPPHDVESPSASDSEEIVCPAPIGTLPRENCAAVAEEFGVLSVSGALQRAGKDEASAARVDAIRAAAALGNQLKEKRVALCEAYNACKMTRQEHAARDKQLADLMSGLLALWDNRRFARPEDVAQFHAGVRDLTARLAGHGAPEPAAQAGAAKATPAIPELAGSKLVQVPAPGVAFSTSGDAVTVQAPAGGSRLVLRSGPSLPLRGGRRYLVKVSGTYTPATPKLLSPGDEIVGRVRYRAAEPAELFIALRSLEDPEAAESTTMFRLAAGEKGAHEAKLIADPAASGFYLAVGTRGSSQIHLDDVELVRGGSVLAAARGEEAAEPMVKTSCALDDAQPLAGKRSLRCQGKGDLVTLGRPEAYLELAIRGRSGDRAVVRTQSLEGGRSLDATLREEAELVVSLIGPGTATLRTITMRAVEP